MNETNIRELVEVPQKGPTPQKYILNLGHGVSVIDNICN